jgi:hypothetical protein
MRLIRRLFRQSLDRVLIPLLIYIQYRVGVELPARTIHQELAIRVAADSADYVEGHMPKALQFIKREDLWNHAWAKKNPEGLIAEFGVWNGYSINLFAQKTLEVIYGFDSFIGLHEDWTGTDQGKGGFDRGGKMPWVAKNVRLVKGWFHETLPGFLMEHSEPFAFVHIDCDTYESTLMVLDLIEKRIRVGTIVVFDEYFGYRRWRDGEYKAWQEFVARTQMKYEYVGFSSTGKVATQVTQIDSE